MELKINRSFEHAMQKLVWKEFERGPAATAAALLVLGHLTGKGVAALALLTNLDLFEGIQSTCDGIRTTATEEYLDLEKRVAAGAAELLSGMGKNGNAKNQ